MEGASQPTQSTQEATQPYTDPRRRPGCSSELSLEDKADILCLLHANTPMATKAVRANMLLAPQHILQNDDLDGVTAQDLKIFPELRNRTRDIALRMSNPVKFTHHSFRFGRSPSLCDIVLTDNCHDRVISSIHFRIYMNEQGSLMIEDCSTNGTTVDDIPLREKDRHGRPMPGTGTCVLKTGSIITAVADGGWEVKFIVSVPSRSGCEELYEQNLRKHLIRSAKVPNFGAVKETIGNFWDGSPTYNFTGVLGRGAFATVYRVQTKTEGTIFAAKEIDKRRFLKDGILDTRFDNELKIMRRLEHPNIVDYIGCHQVDNYLYIIMECITGGELSNELLRRQRLPESEVQQITKQTLRALDYLHSKGITHRDVKPDNILISSRDPLIVKLTDFGLSKSVNNEHENLKTFCGTLLYCAPEVYPDYGRYVPPANKRRRYGNGPSRTAPYDSSVDLWSFGAVLFHLLAGKAPITGRGDNPGAQMLDNIMTKPVDFDPLRELGISYLAMHFINALLNKHPALRPSEQVCFSHPWLKDVPDVLDYSGVVPGDVRPQNYLRDVVEEEDEELAENDLISDLTRLTQHNYALDEANHLGAVPDELSRPPKKPKMTRTESGIPEEIIYPHLPTDSGTSLPQARDTGAPRLFGEITPSVLKSSGLFGTTATAVAMPAAKAPDEPQIRSRLEQVSMNDFAIISKGHGSVAHKAHDTATIQGERSGLGVPRAFDGAATSLMGAEVQLGQMKMGSSGFPNANPPRASSGSPVPQETDNFERGEIEDNSVQSLAHPDDKSRYIDVDLLTDDVAFAAEQKLRQNAREENARLKAETFHVLTRPAEQTVAVAPGLQNTAARTFNDPLTMEKVQPEILDENARRPMNGQGLRQISASALTTTLEVFGKLVPVPGSFDDSNIPLTARSTIWGRAPGCNCQFSNQMDTRVPKFGMKIIFHAPGIEEVERNGEDWTKVPRIHTVIATSATRGIYVNGVRLMKASEDNKAALFGTIYTGDIVTVFDSPTPGNYLKYRVEIYFGLSAQQRPETQQPFEIREEHHFYGQTMRQHLQTANHRESRELSVHPARNQIEVV